jgi:hypothetical protein
MEFVINVLPWLFLVWCIFGLISGLIACRNHEGYLTIKNIVGVILLCWLIPLFFIQELWYSDFMDKPRFIKKDHSE